MVSTIEDRKIIKIIKHLRKLEETWEEEERGDMGLGNAQRGQQSKLRDNPKWGVGVGPDGAVG